MENKLYYIKPATCFEEALLIGNGRLGAIVYGKTDIEKISLNEESVWTGRLADNPVPQRSSQAYYDAKKAIEAGDINKAEYLIEKFFTSEWTQIYSSPGSLCINFNHDKVSDYERVLHLDSGIANISYKYDNCVYNREIFASVKSDCIAIKLTASQKEKISFKMKTELLQNVTGVNFDNGTLVAKCYCPSYATEYEREWCRYDEDDTQNIHFTEIIKIEQDGGSCRFENNEIFVENANAAYIYIDIRTNFAYLIGSKKTPDDNTISVMKGYDEIKRRHAEKFSELYNRVSLELGKICEKPTDERLREFDGNDLGLYELLFNYGRYLLISSSYGGMLPANLQGIWNEKLYSPWCSNFTLNINLQMNYWHAYPCNLEECFVPFVNYAKRLCENGKRTAREYYNASGSVCHSASDIWAHTNPIGRGRTGCSTCAPWNMSLGWIACQMYDAYLYNLDDDYLKNDVYPVIEEAARFYSEVMSQDKDGYYVLTPSCSPENLYVLNGENHALDITAEMSMSIIRELFAILIECNNICEDRVLVENVKYIYDRLRPMKLRKDGRISEWYHEFDEQDILHRHLSHLYSLYPGHSMDERYRSAAEKVLEVKGNDGTGWSLAWKLCMWAELENGNKALKLLENQLRLCNINDEICYSGGGGVYPNMLAAHPPFQIDANFGAAAGIAHMLLKSRKGEITILPALPDRWQKGIVTGLRAVGNIFVDIEWKNNTVSVSLTAKNDTLTEIKVGNKVVTASLCGNKKTVIQITDFR